MEIVVTVDGGGSRCRLVAHANSGKRLAEAELKAHASLTLGVNDAWAHICQGLDALKHSPAIAPLLRATHLPNNESSGQGAQTQAHMSWQPDCLALGLAGALPASRQAALRALMPSGTCHVLVTDGYAQLVGSFAGGAGACLSVGTGSVIHWLDHEGQSGMAGGWGFPIGDEGSGAWIGFKLVQGWLRHRDSRSTPSVLYAPLRQTIGDDVSSIQPWLARARSTDYAALAMAVFDAADEGDTVACRLVDDAVDEVVELIGRAPADLPLCLRGSVAHRMTERLAERLPGRWQVAEGDAAEGLLHLALIELGHSNCMSATARVVE